MKFQEYLEEIISEGMMGRTFLDYKMLKAEVARLGEQVENESLTAREAQDRFSDTLKREFDAVDEHWARHVRLLGQLSSDFLDTLEPFLEEDMREGGLSESMRPVALLEPLQPWLELAARADALRRHRLLQTTALVKIGKKFSKTMDGLGRLRRTSSCSSSASAGSGDFDGCCEDHQVIDASRMLSKSALGDDRLHKVCQRLEAVGDTMLRLGLGAAPPEADDGCAICIGNIMDPVRLPCGHRFCIHCVLPLFDSHKELEGDAEAAMLRCPLCRAEGPEAPQALCLDGLLPRMQRGLCGVPLKQEDHRFVAVVVSSLWKLAEHDKGFPGSRRVGGRRSAGSTASRRRLGAPGFETHFCSDYAHAAARSSCSGVLAAEAHASSSGGRMMDDDPMPKAVARQRSPSAAAAALA